MSEQVNPGLVMIMFETGKDGQPVAIWHSNIVDYDKAHAIIEAHDTPAEVMAALNAAGFRVEDMS